MPLDLLEFEPEHLARALALSKEQRVALACWSAERLVPLYKNFRDGDDWFVVEPIVEACWIYVKKGKAKLPAKLWKRVGQLTSYYYYEGEPLLLYGICAGSDLLDAVSSTGDEASAVATARVLKVIVRAAEEVDVVLGSAPRAENESRTWIESQFQRLAEGGPLEPSAVDLGLGVGLPEWWDELAAHPQPVRRVKLD